MCNQEPTTAIAEKIILVLLEIDFDKPDFLQSDTHKNESLSYFKSYFEFLEYFAKHKPYEEHEFIVGANMVYGWMPTMLRTCQYSDEIKNILIKAQAARIGSSINILDKGNYETLAKGINKSIVGASKLLHFINPSVYPIIDSNIIDFFNKKLKINVDGTCINNEKDTYSYYKSTQAERYVEYKDICHEIIKHPDFDGILNRAKEILTGKCYLSDEQKKGLEKITEIRVLEFLFFELGKLTT